MSISVLDKSLCCGCGACEQICPYSAIQMGYDAEGFYTPKIKQRKCTNCGLCEKACICISGSEKNIAKHAYGAKHLDSDVHSASQSGGAFMGIAQSIIEDSGIVYGASLCDDFRTRHIRVDNSESLKKLQGTKYVQSELGDTYKNIANDIKEGRKVLFSGLPCQVGGLKQYIKIRHISDSNLYTCDLICFGMPSPMLFDDWISCLQKTYHGKLKCMSFRDTDSEWGKGKEKYTFISGAEKKSAFYTSLYFEHFIDRKSCHNCQFCGTERPGDITIGDFWGIGNIDKSFYDNRGVSAMLINTDKGIELYQQLSGKIITREYTIADVCVEQPGLLGRAYSSNKRRNEFWDKYRLFGIKYVAQERGELEIDLSYKILYRLNNIYNKLKKRL